MKEFRQGYIIFTLLNVIGAGYILIELADPPVKTFTISFWLILLTALGIGSGIFGEWWHKYHNTKPASAEYIEWVWGTYMCLIVGALMIFLSGVFITHLVEKLK